MMPTTDASNPVTSTVTTGAVQGPISQQNPQPTDFDFDLDFSDTTQNPVSDAASVDQDVQSAEPVGVQNSDETAAPDAHSDLDFSLDLPDSYTGDASENVSSVENVEDSQVVDQVSPVEESVVESQPVVSEPDFGSLLNEEQSPDPVSSEPVEAPVESALENDLEPVEEATTFQSEEQPAVTHEEALESQEASNELTSEVVAEPIAEVDEEVSEELSDGESDLEFSPEDFGDDTLPMAEEDSFSEDDETTPVFENEITPEESGSMFSSEDAPVEDTAAEMQENSDFTLENQTESSAFSSPYEGEEAHTEVQSFQPAEEVQVENTIDPFEAMKVSLEPENTEQTQSSVQMSSENTAPMMENALHEEMPTVNNESYQAQTSVAPFVQNADVPSQSLDIPMQTQAEQAQPSAFQQGVSLDTLSAQTPVQEVPQVQAVSEGHVAPQMLSLDEMLAQPAAQVPQQVAPVMDLTSLTVGAQNTTNPLTNPTTYPTVQAAGNDGLMKKVLAGVGGIVLVALAGVMVYIKYPLMFGSGGDTPQQPATQSGTLQPQLALNTSGDQADHFAAGQEGENTDQNSLVSWDVVSNQTTDDSGTEVEVNTPVQEEEVEDVVLGGDEEASSASGENSVSGLNTVSEQQKKTENTTLSGDSAPDALNSVEDLVGPVNSNDVLGQEIELYRQKAQQIADTGRAQNVRMMVKWGTAVAKQIEKIQQELANGGNMTISEWNQKKAELDISLAKATNE